MTEDRTLREKVREAIQAGRLPVEPPERTWGGRGCGAYRCTICGEPINPDQVEFELEYSTCAGQGQGDGSGNGNGNGSGNPRVHLRCYSAWDVERQEAALNYAAMCASGLPVASGDGTINGRECQVEDQRGAG